MYKLMQNDDKRVVPHRSAARLAFISVAGFEHMVCKNLHKRVVPHRSVPNSAVIKRLDVNTWYLKTGINARFRTVPRLGWLS